MNKNKLRSAILALVVATVLIGMVFGAVADPDNMPNTPKPRPTDSITETNYPTGVVEPERTPMSTSNGVISVDASLTGEWGEGHSPIIVEFTFPAPEITKVEDYDSITMEELYSYGDSGMPVLPFKTVKILIPHGEDVKDIDIVAGNKVVLKRFFNIECGQTPVPISSEAKDVKTMPNQTMYASMHPFPGNLYSQVSIPELRGYRILILNLHPVQYTPKIGEISYFEEMKVIVTTTTPVSTLSTAKTTFRGLPQDKARVLDVVDNPAEVDTYSTGTKTTGVRSTSIVDPADSYNYVIITDSTLESAFQPLVDWKNRKGVHTTIVTVDQITSDPSYNGVDTQEEIRNWDQYQFGALGI